MNERSYPDQVLLAAIGVGLTDAVMGYRGAGISSALLGEGGGLESPAEHFPSKGYPREPGLYVWRGVAAIYGDHPQEPNDYDWSWEIKGEWSKATAEDIAALMGVTDPPTDDAEDGPDDTDRFGY